MCQAIPREVLQVESGRAEVLIDGRPVWVVTHELPDLQSGEYVLVYAGQALERMEREDALALLQDLADLDAMFDELLQEGPPQDGTPDRVKTGGT